MIAAIIILSRYRLLLILLFLLPVYRLFAGNPVNVRNFKTHQACFIENKGQLPLTPKGEKTSEAIKYYIHDGNVNVYCRPGKISFVFSKTETNKNISEATGIPVETHCMRLNHASAIFQYEASAMPLPRDAFNASLQSRTTASRLDLILLNSNPNSEILATDQQEYYENYYTTGNADSGITNVHTYKTITYKSVYPNIDMVLHAKEGGMKYEFVVYPGGKVSDIQLQWNGLDMIKKLKDSPSAQAGKIEYSFALGKMTESAPYSYVGAGFTPAQSSSITKIESHFVLKNNRIGFKTGKYDKSKTLVIDPTLVWSTYFVGSSLTFAQAVATDATGNVYFSGASTRWPGHFRYI